MNKLTVSRESQVGTKFDTGVGDLIDEVVKKIDAKNKLAA